MQNSTDGPVAYQPELWDPDTDTWTVLSGHQQTRLYHSTALLLPDARILVAGGGAPGPETNLNAEIFSPPYLFNGDQPAARPTISASPNTVLYGSSFDISVSADVAKVSFVRAGAVTHSFNSGTRWMELPITGTGTERSVQAPATAADAPPGTYMLFAMDAQGTPSVAAMIDIDPGDPVPPEPDPEPDPDPESDPDPMPTAGLVSEALTIDDILRATDYDPVMHGEILRLYHAFFGRAPDPDGAKYWIHDVYQQGQGNIAGITQWFATEDQPEFAAQYADIGSHDSEEYLRRVYHNMLGRQPDEAGFQYWKALMDDGTLNRGNVVRFIGVNEEFVTHYPYLSQ